MVTGNKLLLFSYYGKKNRYRVTYFGDQKVRTFQSILQLREFQSILLYFTAYEEDRKIYFLFFRSIKKISWKRE